MEFPVRVQLTEGGGGATYVCHCYTAPANSSQICVRGDIAGKGGNVADLNLSVEPGSTCPISVGYGATSYHTLFRMVIVPVMVLIVLLTVKLIVCMVNLVDMEDHLHLVLEVVALVLSQAERICTVSAVLSVRVHLQIQVVQ